MNKIKIISDGTPTGTKVFDEDGNCVPMIQRIEIVIDVNHPVVRARLECVLPELNMRNVQVSELQTVGRSKKRKK